MKKILNILTLFLGITLSFAQQYPVRLIPVVIPPYSLKLGDYATSTDNKLQLQVLMTDLMEPQHQTGIKFSLQAGLNAVPFAQSNDFVVGMQPFMLYPGSNITLTNVDLRALFELQNLNGINANQYAQPLSDGVYQFCFQAYDFYTKNNLSQKTCATVFLTQYDPPMLNLPQNAEKVQAVSPYSGGAGIVFQWMPRQIAPNTKYIFTLKELWDLGQSPISGFLSSPPLWREETYAPTLFYGVDKTQLMPGKRYAWQVQAKSGNPVVGANPTDDNGVYKNNGLSEIFYFDYVENCALPTLLMAKNVGRGRVELSWNLAGQPSGLYNVQWRKRGSTSEWQTAQSYQPKYIVTGLEDQTEYEYRIGSVCGNLQTFNNTNPITDGNSAGNAYAYSGIQFFTTDANSTNNNYQCGVMPVVDIANKSPLQSLLGANEVFTAGDFPVTVISAQGSNGIYSGTGYIVVPYLADTKVKVSFNNIKLNTDKKLIEGAIETTYDPNETAVSYASAGLGETFGDAGVKEVTINFPIGGITYSATPPPGKITITGSDGGGGTGSTVDYPGGKDYQFKDKAGNIWTVDENGTVTQNGKVAEGGASNSTNTDGVTGSGNNATVNQYTAKGIKIVWEENSSGKYAYDTQKKTNLPVDKYPSVKDADGSPVSVSYKATVNKQTELFDAKVSITDPALKDAKIEFKTLSIGKAIPAKELNKTDAERTYQLELVGAFDYAEEEVIAVVVPKDSTAKQQVISSFRLVHLSPKDINVALVPTDAESKNKLSNIETQTKAIYKKVGVNINFNRDDVFDIAPYLNGGTVIPTEKNTALSTYSSVQQSINKGYGNKNSDRYILFVADRNSDKAGQLGYMRLNGQFGYVFKEGLSLTKTGAHELGHGIFKLEHPFENLGLGEKTTPLLMDYRTGDNDIILSHLDWKQINDPAFKLYAFQSQSSGELAGKYDLDPNLKPVYIQSNYIYKNSDKDVPLGTLSGFSLGTGNDEEFFYWDSSANEYVNTKNQKINQSKHSSKFSREATLANSEELFLYQYSSSCVVKYMLVTYGDIKSKSTDQLANYFTSNYVRLSKIKIEGSKYFKAGITRCTSDNPQKIDKTKKEEEGNGNGDANGNGTETREETLQKLNDIVINKLKEKFPEKEVKFTILDKKDPQYQQKLDEALKQANYVIAVMDEEGKVQIKSSFKIPEWLANAMPDLGKAPEENCSNEYINEGLTSLQNSTLYKNALRSQQIAMELGVIAYRGVFGTLYCMTDEKKFVGASSANQFVGGAMHEAIATFDVAQIVEGVISLVKSGAEQQIMSPITYYNNLKEISTQGFDTNNEVKFAKQVMGVVLLPPSNTAVDNIEKGVKVAKQLYTYYADCGNMCWYRYGEASVIVIPAVISGGSWAAGRFALKYPALANKALRTIEVLQQNVNRLWKLERKAGKLSLLDETGKEIKNYEQFSEFIDDYDNLPVGGTIRFIAKTGEELKTYLNALNDLPKGITYDKNMYRYKATGAPYNVTDINPTMNPLENRFKVGLYTSASKDGNLIEVNAYEGITGKTQYEISNVKVDNLLDLTDKTTIEKLGTSFDQMKLSGVDNKYEYTHVVTDWAKSRGYSGIKFYGAQGTGQVYENFIIFEQTTVNKMIINSKITDIKW